MMPEMRFATLVAILLALAGSWPGAPAAAGTAPEPPSTYMLEAVRIEGLARTDEALVRELLLLGAGDPFDEELARASRLRLLTLGLFTDVRMHLEKGRLRGWVVWVLEVEERPPLVLSGIFLASGAHGGPAGGGRIQHIDLFGRGETLGLALVNAEGLSAGGELAWSQPSFSPAAVTLDAGLLAADVTQLLAAPSGAVELRYRRIGVRAAVGVRASPLAQISLRLRVEHIEAVGDPDPARDEELALAGRTSLLTTIGLRADVDHRNHFYLPDRGAHYWLELEHGSSFLGSDYGFSQAESGVELYLGGPADHYLRLGAAAGAATGRPPLFDKYSRSAVLRGIGPAPFLGVTFDDEIPEEFFGVASFDYYLPLRERQGPLLYRLVGYLFVDTGRVLDDRRRWSGGLDTVLGAGLLADTQVGTFRVHLGVEP